MKRTRKDLGLTHKIKRMIRNVNLLRENELTQIIKINFIRKIVQCYNCEKWSHMAKDCWYNKGKGVYKDKDGDEAKMAQEDLYGYEIMVFIVAVSNDYSDHETWLLDTGLSNHMSGHTSWLSNLMIQEKAKLYLLIVDHCKKNEQVIWSSKEVTVGQQLLKMYCMYQVEMQHFKCWSTY